jgi:hypothetical protein
MTDTKRMTGIDYRREFNLIRQSELSLRAHVEERLLQLKKLYPEAEIDSNSRIKELSSIWIKNMTTITMIKHIEKIEEWSAEKEPVIQTKIKL